MQDLYHQQYSEALVSRGCLCDIMATFSNYQTAQDHKDPSAKLVQFFLLQCQGGYFLFFRGLIGYGYV